jgi:hypothetical protein
LQIDVDVGDVVIWVSLPVILSKAWRFLQALGKRCIQNFQGQWSLIVVVIAPNHLWGRRIIIPRR